MKRIWILALILVVVLALAACGGGNGDTDDNQATNGTVTNDTGNVDTNGTGDVDTNGNGVDPNGNGVDPNGVDPNGNGVDPNGVDPNGVDPNGDDPNGDDPYDVDPNGDDPNGNGEEPDPTPAPPAAGPTGNALRMTYGATWDTLRFPQAIFTDQGNHTITFYILHPAHPDGNYVQIGVPEARLVANVWSFLEDDFNTPRDDSPEFVPGVWTRIEYEFNGLQAYTCEGLTIAGVYPRPVGTSFYIADLVIRNASGVVVSENFAGVTASAGADSNYLAGAVFSAPWAGGTLAVVPAP